VNANEALILNLTEVRRRSLALWNGIPSDRLHWKPDHAAMTCIEMVRHVLEGEILYMWMLDRGESLESEDSPFTGREVTNVEDDVAFESPYRIQLIELIRSYTPRISNRGKWTGPTKDTFVVRATSFCEWVTTRLCTRVTC
jgi:hypothetical protein